MTKTTGLDPVELKMKDFDKPIFKVKASDARKAMEDLNEFAREKGII